MIKIPPLMNVGGRMLPLAKCYDSAHAERSVTGKLRKAGTLFTVRHVQVAQKKLALIYCDPDKV